MITIANTASYSIENGAGMAYEIEYSDGCKVRAVESAGNIIRKEYLHNGEWLLSGKPYVVKKNNARQAERIKATVIEQLNA